MINNNKIIITIATVVVVIIILIMALCTFKESESEIDIIETKEENITIQETEEKTEKIIIHITGCIKNEGIVEMNKGARIIDVIEMAGGITEDADITKVNLAYIVKDAQKIYIPSINDAVNIEYITTENGDNVIVENKYEGGSNMVNINTATQTELENLSGIGPSTALKIINYREEHGKFKSIEEIKEVPGIGDAKFNNIKDMIEI